MIKILNIFFYILNAHYLRNPADPRQWTIGSLMWALLSAFLCSGPRTRRPGLPSPRPGSTSRGWTNSRRFSTTWSMPCPRRVSAPQGGPRRCCQVRARDRSHMLQNVGATSTGQNIKDHGLS